MAPKSLLINILFYPLPTMHDATIHGPVQLSLSDETDKTGIAPDPMVATSRPTRSA
jgi:hypothetical protein